MATPPVIDRTPAIVALAKSLGITTTLSGPMRIALHAAVLQEQELELERKWVDSQKL
jgi:hypothetical protein